MGPVLQLLAGAAVRATFMGVATARTGRARVAKAVSLENILAAMSLGLLWNCKWLELVCFMTSPRSNCPLYTLDDDAQSIRERGALRPSSRICVQTERCQVRRCNCGVLGWSTCQMAGNVSLMRIVLAARMCR